MFVQQSSTLCLYIETGSTCVNVIKQEWTTYVFEQTQHLVVCSVVRDEEAYTYQRATA
jgi:hypothetical protein